MTRDELVGEAAAAFPDIDFGGVSDDETLAGVGLDSLDAAEFILDIEGKYGVAVPDWCMVTTTTWGDFVRAVTGSRRAAARPAREEETRG